MGKGYLMDTNVVVDFLKGNLNPTAFKLVASNLSNISIISKIELLSWNEAPVDYLDSLNTFIQFSTVVNLEEKIVSETILLRKKYKKKLPDTIIAATAISENLILITRNEKDFQNIDNLQLLNPYTI